MAALSMHKHKLVTQTQTHVTGVAGQHAFPAGAPAAPTLSLALLHPCVIHTWVQGTMLQGMYTMHHHASPAAGHSA